MSVCCSARVMRVASRWLALPVSVLLVVGLGQPVFGQEPASPLPECAAGGLSAVDEVAALARYGISEEDALTLGVAHELDGTGDAAWGTDSSKVDLHNNFFGARLGSAMVRQGGPVSNADIITLLMIAVNFEGECPHCPSVLDDDAIRDD